MRSKNISLLQVIGFFFAATMALSAYVGSSYLSPLVGETAVGYVYAIAALITIVSMSALPRVLAKLGVRHLTTLLMIATVAALLVLYGSTSPHLSILAFIAFYALGIITMFSLDLRLEQLSIDTKTGRIRGLYLTVVNTAWLLSPFLAGVLATQTISLVYLAAASMALIATLIALWSATRDREGGIPIHTPSLARAFMRIIRGRNGHTRNVYNALLLDLMLNVFYAIMVIYIPLYLRSLGLSWEQLGLIFTVMLTPFVLFQYVLGSLADRYTGEQEFMVAGLLMMSFASFLVWFTDSSSVLVWMGILFLSRVGASFLEVMKESYLFKHVDGNDAAIIALSRNMMPLSYVIAPLLAALVLTVTLIPSLFFMLGVVLLVSIRFALSLTDTR